MDKVENNNAGSTSTWGNFGNAASTAAMDLADSAVNSYAFALQVLTESVATGFDNHFDAKLEVDNDFIQNHYKNYKNLHTQ